MSTAAASTRRDRAFERCWAIFAIVDDPRQSWRLAHPLDRWWIVAGSLAFPAVVVVFYLMAVKPW
jgi:hypothetical protein